MQKTILITGATGGIGLAMARILALEGHHLILTGRSEEKLARMRSALPQAWLKNVETMIADLADPAAPQYLFDECTRRGLAVDVLVNNAGNGYIGEHLNADMQKIQAMLACNIMALTELCTRFGQEMKRRKSGYMLNIASTAAYQPLPYMASYAASKAYVLHFSEALAKELESDHIVVTAFCPGPTATGFFETATVGGDRFSEIGYAQVDDVARSALDALFSKKLSAVYGRKNAIMIFLERFLPRRAVAAIAKRFMR